MQVGVVGLGKMGSALVRHLLEQGVDVPVWNRSRPPVEELSADGAAEAKDFSDVWRGSTAVCTFLADDTAAAEVLRGDRGLLAAGPGSGLLIELSTISPQASGEIAEEAAARGVRYLRSPVSGNPGVLAAGNLSLIVSGEEDDVTAAEPVLARIGARFTYVGGAERARVVKLAVNSMLACTAEMLAEVVVLAEGWGIDRAVLLTVLEHSAMGSPFVGYKARALVDRDYGATFTLSMLLKDLELARQAADTVSAPMPVVDRVAALTQDGCDEGLSDLDLMALLPHLQALAGRPQDIG